ncbi:site-specific integrase [Acidobacteria bacterium AH-259-L09]|nr:site-specific integrase [Acidobacteria bacterium AH-259-L09]
MGSIHRKTLRDDTVRYEARMRLNGKPVGKRFRRKKDAEEWLSRHSVDVLDGTYRELIKATFAEYVDHWKKMELDIGTYKPSVRASYRHIIAKSLLPRFGPYPITAITSADVNGFIADKLKRGLASNSVRTDVNLLGKIFKDAIGDNFLRHTPMDGVRKPKSTQRRKGIALNPEQIKSLLDTLDSKTSLYVLTAILTGMRQGEQFGLFWEDINWDDDVIGIERSLYWRFGDCPERKPGEPRWIYVAPKTEKSTRSIDLSPRLKKELRKLYLTSKKEGLVFPSCKGTPLIANDFYKNKFKPALEAAGIDPKVRWHDLRHTFGSLKLSQGADIYYVSRQMGHSSIQITVDIYGHLLKKRHLEEAAKTDVMIFGKN